MRAPSGNPAMFWAMAYKISDILMTLTETGALARLQQAPATAEALAAVSNWRAAPLARFLDLLATVGVLERRDDAYALPSSTRAVLPVVVMESRLRRWHADRGSLRAALETGVTGRPLEQIDDAAFLTGYQQAMAASARALALHVYRYAAMPAHGIILDIGGADGALAGELAALLPRTSYCIVDRPPVAAHFDARVAGMADRERFRFVADDITRPQALDVEIAAADAAIVSNVLHLLSDREIDALLHALRSGLRSGARLAVYDQFLDPACFSAADLMTVDWACVGAEFSLTDHDMCERLVRYGFAAVTSRRFPLVPGALVCASAP
ncbi:methyltransferase [Burkholderia glumae]|uniref:methyltransferase n=1 Tax=Burkholderia glumae TaxID=337 RepID=UPI00148ED73D|nr:class I SAM-dependent methyltransferase [Burkholderia glumae]MCQ0029894.1 methyltransferase [Burkholderia glumae]QJW81926.1 methyltransferase [Burkholderia glumae]